MLLNSPRTSAKENDNTGRKLTFHIQKYKMETGQLHGKDEYHAACSQNILSSQLPVRMTSKSVLLEYLTFCVA